MNYLFIFLVNLIYLPTLWYGVVSDDALTMKVDPYNLKLRRLFNIILHLLICEYIYIAFGSLPAALCFAVHPLVVQVPAWCTGRQYGINALLFLMAAAFAPIGVLSFLACYNGAAVTVLLTPLVWLTTKYWWLAFMILAILTINYKNIFGGIAAKKSGGIFSDPLPTDYDNDKFHARKLILVVKTFGYYALACLLPIKNGFYNSFLASYGSGRKVDAYWYSLNRHFWGGLFAIAIMFVLWFVNMHNFIGTGIMLFVLSICPFLNFITIQQHTAPRYVYLALIGYQVALWGLIAQMGVIVEITALCMAYAFYLTQLIRVLRIYRTNNQDMLYLDCQTFPDSIRLWYYKVQSWLQKKQWVMAFADAAMGLKYNPGDCQLYFGMAVASYNMGDVKGASFFLQEAESNMVMSDRKEMRGMIEELKNTIKKGAKC